MVVKKLPSEVLSSIEESVLVNAARHDGKADPGAVTGRVLGSFPELRTKSSDVKAAVLAEVKRVNGMSIQEQRRLLERKYPQREPEHVKELRASLPPLPNAIKGKASFRLPPEPSGFMHIGHAMAWTVNYLYKVQYSGQLWLRFEDTNPRKVAKRYYDSFREGTRWLGIQWDHEKNVSDDMELMYEQGSRMIKEGHAYACSCDIDRVKKLRFDGKECEHRERPAEESFRIWEEMLAKKHHEGDLVIRFRGDMQSLDYSLRDPNVFRTIEHTHPLTGSRYWVWPTYDLANTIEDETCGITHILRSAEFHNELQKLMRERLKFRRVEVMQFSRYNFKGTPVAKRLLRPLIEKGLVDGWDDPRMPTVEGVKRRGILPEAIRQFTLQVGYTRTEHEYDWSLLYAVNRKLLDPISKRLFFVPSPVPVEVEGARPKSVTLPLHPDKDLGKRSITAGEKLYLPRTDLEQMKKGETFRAMDLYNLELTKSGTHPSAKYAGDTLIQGAKKVQWVSEPNAKVKVLVPGPLFDDSGEFNPDSLQTVEGVAEPSFSALKLGDIVQFPRFGFCRLDSPGTMILAHK